MSDLFILYVGDQQMLVTSEVINADNLLYGRKWNLKKFANEWYWSEGQNPFQIQRYIEGSDTVETLVETDRPYFDLSNGLLIYGEIKQTNSNLYQTTSNQ